MTSGPISLAELLAPLEREVFFREYFERQPLHILAGESAPAIGVTTAAIESLLADGCLTYPSLQLVSDGEYISPDAYANDVTYGADVIVGVLDLRAVSQRVREGATVVVNAVNRYFRPLGALCLALSNDFLTDVNANAYLTPPNAAGFAAHYDTHDVFVVQVEGAKAWTIFDPVINLPLPGQLVDLPQDLAAPRLEVTLSPGDRLYLPRGYLHAARTLDVSSLHVTIGVAPLTWHDLLREAVRLCKSDVRFRASALAFESSAQEPPLATYAELIQLLARTTSPLELTERVRGALSKAPAFPRPDTLRSLTKASDT